MTYDKLEKERREKFGDVLRLFLYKNFDTMKNAAKRLQISAPYLSQVCNGKKKTVGDAFKRKLENYGFDPENFEILGQIEEINPDILSYKEIKFLYLELKELLGQKDQIINSLRATISTSDKKYITPEELKEILTNIERNHKALLKRVARLEQG